jgi:hypothetical protein
MAEVGGPQEVCVKRFSAEADVEQAVTSWLQTLDTDLFYAELELLVPRRKKCLNINGDYVEVWCVPSATHVPCFLEVRMKFSTSRAFV